MTTIADQIIYEDNHLIALNKKAGQIVQGDKTGDRPLCDLVKDLLKERDHKTGNVFCGVVHRLDRPVSGVVVFAKTSKALARMNALVQSREFHKTYWAITRQMPPQPEGTLHDWLVRNERQNKSYVVGPDTDGAKEARLDYRILATSRGGYHLLEIELHTGRHHQIRCQLSHMGCPIRGDLKYGAPRSNPDGNISLHARRLSFIHPVSQQAIELYAPWSEADIFDLP
ncbi:MAG: RluA family pseudouridine synthase [Bacteroidales bacterium]|nr:RluA family pseudouridine synthase [Bacteroidales bacterium]